ncbi:MAG: sulfotransferase family protein [Methylococcales bacterium]|nr:sulfotransferase family protein [Methylococcales bacterium]
MLNIKDWPSPDKEQLFEYLGINGYLCERYKIFYVATPKVACTSLKWWFADLTGYARAIRESTDSRESDPALVIHDVFAKVAADVTGLMPDALLEPLGSDDYFRFAVVRNPYKRIFSAWQSKLLLREPLQIPPYVNTGFFNMPVKNATDLAAAFEAFLEYLLANEAPNFQDMHWTPQADLLRPDLIGYSLIAKLEETGVLSTALSERLGSGFTDPFASKTSNESLIPYLPGYITPRSIELIATLYAKDFQAFGYSLQPPDSKDAFTDRELAVALKAVELIRGRNRRLAEISGRMLQLEQTLCVRGICKVFMSRLRRLLRGMVP